jgi:predicted MFS family arabinose efflux permease
VGGASSLVGALAAERLVRRFGFGRVFLSSAALIGGAALLPPLARGTPAVCALVLSVAQLGDAGWAIYNVNEISLRQAVTPDGLLGRVNSAMHLMFRGVLPLGAFAGGAIAEAIGIRSTMFIGVAGFLVSTLWLVFSPIRKLRELPATTLTP